MGNPFFLLFLIIDQNALKKSRIRETKNLLTDADSRTDTITFFNQKLQVMAMLFEETDKPVGLLKEHVHPLQFPDEKIQSKVSSSPQRAHPSPAIF